MGLAKSKWSLNNIFEPSPKWVRILRWFLYTIIPAIQLMEPTMPISVNSHYWVSKGSILFGFVLLGFIEGFKTKSLNEQARDIYKKENELRSEQRKANE